MKTVPELEHDASRRKAEFAASLAALRQHLTISGLANEGLRVIDPQARLMAPAYAALKRYPVLVAGAVIAATWLWRRLR